MTAPTLPKQWFHDRPGTPTSQCVRLALANRKDWSMCGASDLSIQTSGSTGFRMGRLAGPTFPGWSVGRARLTLNQD
jgi:hypothetical protein